MTAAATRTPLVNRDASTLELLRARDQEGMRQLLEDHGGVVYARLRRLFRGTLCEDDLEEALCRTLARIWQTNCGHDPRLGTMRAWVFVAARNHALCILRERRKDRSLDEFLEVLGSFEGGHSHHERLRRIADFNECLKTLPPLQRVVLQADLDADGSAPTADLAKRLRVNPEAVTQARRRGRAKLRKLMLGLGHFPDSEALPPDDQARPEFEP